MIKKLFAMTTVLGAAALLQNKERRERLICAAKDLIQGARDKMSALDTKARSATETSTDSSKAEEADWTDSSKSTSSTGAGVTTRSAPYSSPPRTGGGGGGFGSGGY